LILLRCARERPEVVPPFEIFARDLTVRGLALPNLMRDDAQLAALKRFVGDGLADGTLRPTIARSFAFDQIADAHRFIEARRCAMELASPNDRITESRSRPF
jgi:NADPH:quinone reductase-like Zn-dependent oxidoreductase